jgi:ABC-type multidrug transport system fused ATPase/permease subunit
MPSIDIIITPANVDKPHLYDELRSRVLGIQALYEEIKGNMTVLANTMGYETKMETKFIFSCDTESTGNNPRSVGFMVVFVVELFNITNGQKTLVKALGTVISKFMVNIIPGGVADVFIAPENIQEVYTAADSEILDGARTLKEFWHKNDTMRAAYEHLNATSVSLSGAVKHILEFIKTISDNPLKTPVILAARPLAYEAAVLTRIFDRANVLNPFAQMGAGTGMDFNQIITGATTEGIYSPVGFAKYLSMIGVKSLAHESLSDAVDQFHAFWLFKQNQYPGLVADLD